MLITIGIVVAFEDIRKITGIGLNRYVPSGEDEERANVQNDEKRLRRIFLMAGT